METIIGLLIFLVPIVFKLIGKRLEQAAKMNPPTAPDDTEPIENWEEVLKEYLEVPKPKESMIPRPMAEDSVEKLTPQKPTSEKPKHPHKPVKRAPILVEEEKKPKEKIDVKKMIVYSEIMKPKYTEKVEY